MRLNISKIYEIRRLTIVRCITYWWEDLYHCRWLIMNECCKMSRLWNIIAVAVVVLFCFVSCCTRLEASWWLCIFYLRVSRTLHVALSVDKQDTGRLTGCASLDLSDSIKLW